MRLLVSVTLIALLASVWPASAIGQNALDGSTSGSAQCPLLTTSEASEVIGSPVEGHGASQFCLFYRVVRSGDHIEPGSLVSIRITITREPSGRAAQSYEQASHYSNAQSVDLGSGTQAVWFGSAFNILQGDSVALVAFGGGGLQTQPAPALVKIGKLIAGRMSTVPSNTGSSTSARTVPSPEATEHSTNGPGTTIGATGTTEKGMCPLLSVAEASQLIKDAVENPTAGDRCSFSGQIPPDHRISAGVFHIAILFESEPPGFTTHDLERTSHAALSQAVDLGSGTRAAWDGIAFHIAQGDRFAVVRFGGFGQGAVGLTPGKLEIGKLIASRISTIDIGGCSEPDARLYWREYLTLHNGAATCI